MVVEDDKIVAYRVDLKIHVCARLGLPAAVFMLGLLCRKQRVSGIISFKPVR
jgi:hypothetical protein